MLRPLNPPSIHPPFAAYAHGIAVPAGARLVVCSGQLGIMDDGRIPEGVEAQAELCFAAIAAILTEDAMTLDDLVRINAFVTGREHLKGYMAVRDRILAGRVRASTLMIVSGFARPDFVVEIEAIAARV